MNAIALTRNETATGRRSKPLKPPAYKRSGQLLRFSRAAIIDDLFFASIVAAILCLSVVFFSRTLVQEWQKPPAARITVTGQAMPPPGLERSATNKVSLERGARLTRFPAREQVKSRARIGL